MHVKPKDGEYEQVTAALKECGLDHFVAERCNQNTVGAYVREELSEDRGIPVELEAVLEINEVVDVRARSVAQHETTSGAAARNLRKDG